MGAVVQALGHLALARGVEMRVRAGQPAHERIAPFPGVDGAGRRSRGRRSTTPARVDEVGEDDRALGVGRRHAVIGDHDPVDRVCKAARRDTGAQAGEHRVDVRHRARRLRRGRTESVAGAVGLVEVEGDQARALRRRQVEPAEHLVDPLLVGHRLVVAPPKGRPHAGDPADPANRRLRTRPERRRRHQSAALGGNPDRLSLPPSAVLDGGAIGEREGRLPLRIPHRLATIP